MIRQEDLDAYRLIHDHADGLPGLVIERLGCALIVQLHQERIRLADSEIESAARFFHERLGTRAIYRKYFVKDRSKPTPAMDEEHHRARPWIGEPVEPAIPVMEHGLRFLIHAYDGYSTGLFLEHRDNRQRIRDLSRGRRVLNTFSYTCGFSVAAAAGGGVAVDSVDVYKRYLEWGKENFTANAIDLANHKFFASDVGEFYARAERQGRRYGLVILDPPTFARLRRPHRPFVLDEQLESLCHGAMKLLEPGGHILLSTNQRTIPPGRLESVLRSASKSAVQVERLRLPGDFSGDPGYAKTVLGNKCR